MEEVIDNLSLDPMTRVANDVSRLTSQPASTRFDTDAAARGAARPAA